MENSAALSEMKEVRWGGEVASTSETFTETPGTLKAVQLHGLYLFTLNESV